MSSLKAPTALQIQVAAYCRELGLPEPVAEYRFDNRPEPRKWALDWAWPAVKGRWLGNDGKPLGGGFRAWSEVGSWVCDRDGVALEVHGAVYQEGRHTRGAGFEADREKMAHAVAQGWRVIEVSTGQLWKPWLWQILRQLLTGT